MVTVPHPDTPAAKRIWLLVILILVAPQTLKLAAAEPSVSLVISSEQPIYRSTAALIQQHLQGKYQLQSDITDDLSLTNPDPTDPNHLLVAIGSEAASRLALKPGEAPVLATLIPQAVIEDLNRQRTAIDQKSLSPFYALQIDQPPERTLALIDIALPNSRSVAVLLGPSSRQYAAPLKVAAQRLDIKLRMNILPDGGNIIREAETILTGSDLLLTLPDPLIYNRQTTQNLLLYTFRNQIPVIGYSQSFVKAGALMGIFSTPEQIAEQTADLIDQHHRRGNLPAITAPAYLSLAVNRHVARSFGLVLEPDETLLNKLMTRLGLHRDR